MRISEAREAIKTNHPNVSRSQIKKRLDRQMEAGFSIEQAKARVEQNLYAHYETNTTPKFRPTVPESRLPKHLCTN